MFTHPFGFLGGAATSDFFPDQIGIARAYSWSRKLVPSYSGSALRIRRSSDNAEQDIGYTGLLLDESALTTFVGANDGFVVTVFDNTGNIDLTQATASFQPQLVTSGTINKDAGNSNIYADTLGVRWLKSATGTLTQPGAVFAVANRQSTPGGSELLYDKGGAGGGAFWRMFSNTLYQNNAGLALLGPTTDTNKHIFTFLVNGVSSEQYIESALTASGDAGSNTNEGIVWGANSIGTLNIDAFLYELIYYEGDKSSSRQSIETNQASFFGISLLNQTSLIRTFCIEFKLVSGYSGSAIRVRRSSDNAEQDIGFIGLDFDEADMLSFVGANNGFVVTIYDQSVSGNDLTNAVSGEQPLIVVAGTTLKDSDNNIFTDVDLTKQLVTTTGTIAQPGTMFTVFKQNTGASTIDRWIDSTVGGSRWSFGERSAAFALASPTFRDGSVSSANFNKNLHTGLLNSPNSVYRFNSADTGINPITGTNSMGGIAIASNLGTDPSRSDINFYVLLIYDADKTFEFTAIEAELKNLYSTP